MWRNTEVRDFANWLREHNAQASTAAGFYGMDLYSLFRSRDAVLAYLDQVDPNEAERARERYAAFNSVGDDPQNYGALVARGRLAPATAAVREQFERVKQITSIHRTSADPAVAEAAFNAEQNARLVMNAEEYYREMYNYWSNTWNLRDRHMADTVDALAQRLRERDGYAKIAIWAHNSHLGDARATDSAFRGEWNVGQLIRERHPGESFHIGFSTHSGTVMATTNWGDPGVVKQVRPSLQGSYERLFHDTGVPTFLLPLSDPQFKQPMLQRAIGVQYLPETERQSHYFGARLGDQFDMMIHIDQTTALQPLPQQELVSEQQSAA
jgi:erythromycin esterase-like protein